MKISKIQSSGLEGAEKAAFSAAKKVGIPIIGWQPKDGPCVKKEIKETPSIKPEQSIIWNVRDSHATLIIGLTGDSDAASLSYEVAESYRRPVLISTEPAEIVKWLNTLGDELILNVTGPNKKEDKSIDRKTKTILGKVFEFYDSMLLGD